MSFYSTVKKVYVTVFPRTVRHFTYKHMPKCLKVARSSIIRKLERSAEFDEIYDDNYFFKGEDPVYDKSCQMIAESIVKVFSPRSVIDVGCGPGVLLLALKEQGLVCRGLEYSSAALKVCRQKGLDVTRFDLRREVLPEDFKADVVVSTEVAEHLPEHCADHFVNILCAIADNVIITAAEPATTYVGDHTHLNEQPKEYWIGKFAIAGFKCDEDISTQFRTDWKKRGIKGWFVQHLMVFRKEPCSQP